MRDEVTMKHGVHWGAGLLLLSIVTSSPRLNTDARHAPIAFVHVAVIDANLESVSSDMTVVIEGDHIVSVVKSAAAKVPARTHVVDARGKFLLPGLWDMHVHVFRHDPRSAETWFFPLFIANGVTGVRDMWTTGDDFPQVLQWRKGLNEGTFLGPRFGAVGWLVDGPGSFFSYADIVKTPEEAREFVRKVKATGIDFVKTYQKLPRDEFFAIASEAKKVGIPFAGHVPWAVGAAEASDAGESSNEHLSNVGIGCSTKEEDLLQAKSWGPPQAREMLDTYDQERCQQLAERLVKNQTWQVPTSWLFLRTVPGCESC